MAYIIFLRYTKSIIFLRIYYILNYILLVGVSRIRTRSATLHTHINEFIHFFPTNVFVVYYIFEKNSMRFPHVELTSLKAEFKQKIKKKQKYTLPEKMCTNIGKPRKKYALFTRESFFGFLFRGKTGAYAMCCTSFSFHSWNFLGFLGMNPVKSSLSLFYSFAI